MKEALLTALDLSAGVLARRQHPRLVHAIDHAVRRSELCVLFPGVYCRPEHAHEFAVRALAVSRADPEAILTGTSAAYAHRPGGTPPALLTAATHKLRPRPGYLFEHRGIPAALVEQHRGILVTSRALTAIDLAAPEGAALDEALRTGVSLDALWAAYRLTPQRPGNTLRRHLLVESRDRPWSPAERAAHRALRGAGIHGWRTNLRLDTPVGTVFADLAFPALRLIIEIDGWAHHSSRASFQRDRRRDRALALVGWVSVRFAASELDDPERFANEVRALVRARAEWLT